MANELVVFTWCDLCLERGEHEEGHPTPVIGGRLLDLCKHDRETLLDPLAEVLDRLGRKAEGAPRSGEARRKSEARMQRAEGPVTAGVGPEDHPYRCLVCDRPSPTSGALGGHLRASHDASVADVYGLDCPVCGGSFASAGMGMHLTKTHGIRGGIVVATEWALAHGDPAGVVDRRLALLNSA